MRLGYLVTLVFVAAGACAHPRYVYSPTTITSADVSGRPAASFAIPRGSPEGNLSVATFGILDIRSISRRVPALHLRVTIRNRSDEMWEFRGDEQYVELEPGDGVATLLATTQESGPAPTLRIPPRESRTVDLYFKLPEARTRASDIPAFDAYVTMRTGVAVATERVHVKRFRVDTSPPIDISPTLLPGEFPSPQPSSPSPSPKAPQ